jgi:hypothetical protein
LTRFLFKLTLLSVMILGRDTRQMPLLTLMIASLQFAQPNTARPLEVTSDEHTFCRKIEGRSQMGKRNIRTICATREEWKRYGLWLNKQDREAFPVSGR